MIKNLFDSIEKEKLILLLLLFIFILTELVDDFFDSLLGSSIKHSIIQICLFSFLFVIVVNLFQKYSKNKISKLIPPELMNFLFELSSAEDRGLLYNQAKLQRKLNITKPTMKKRIDSLIELKYIRFQEKGNNKYLSLTEKGKLILK